MAMPKKILISIVTPVYNRDFCIERAINSVRSLIIPSGYDYEHIIVDDGSTDKTIEVIKNNLHNRLVFIKKEHNSGVNATRNVGIKKAKGDYILLFDSDDELVPKALEVIKSALEKTGFAFVAYKFQTCHAQTKKLMTRIKNPYKRITYEMRLEGSYLGGEFISLLKRSAIKKLLFDENRFAFETFFWNKLAKVYNNEVGIPKVIRLYHDEHEDRLSDQLVDLRFVKKRFSDYKLYIDTFEEDYKSFDLNKQLSSWYFRTGLYAALSKQKGSISREYFGKSIKKSFSFSAKLGYILTYFGHVPFRVLLHIYKKVLL